MSEYENRVLDYLMQMDQNQSTTDGRVNIINQQLNEVIESQNNIKDYLCVYTGCINLILMISLILSCFPVIKGVAKK